MPSSENHVRALIRYFVVRFQNRPDSEHQQALVRLAIAVLMTTYLGGMALGGATGQYMAATFALICAETLLGLGIIVHIGMRPSVNVVRRVIGMFGDYVSAGMVMFLLEGVGAPFYIVLLWVTVGNGLRYGKRFLHAAIAAAFTTMTLVVLNTAFWQASPALAWGLVVGTVAIPLYLSSLIRDLNATIDEARRVSKSKSQFLADMSQEFRTPLNGIVGMAELLATSSLSPEQMESAEVIQTSARSLQLLVDDVLDVSALESGALKRSDVDFRVSEIVKSVQVMLMPTAMAKGIGFKVAVQPYVPNRLHGDAPHLRQILLNLGARAVRTALDGRVAMNVTLLGDAGAGSVRLRFAVRHVPARGAVVWDPRLTGATQGAESAVPDGSADTILAATIVRTLTDLLGGAMGSDSASGNGAQVWVDLPFALADQDVDVHPVLDQPANVVPFDDPCLRHRARVRTLRVLVADDQAANRLVVQRIVERAGHIVVPACDGVAALELARTGEYDVAIIDMHLPRCNAPRLIAELNRAVGEERTLPVIVLSADATVGAMRAATEAGAQACLSKPIAIGRLLEELADVAVRSGAPGLAAVEPATSVDNRVIADLAALRLGPSFVKDFVEQCIVDAEGNLHAMEGAIIAQHWSALNEAADALRGVCVNLGARMLASRCAELMKLSPDVVRREWRARLESIRAQLEIVKTSARAEARQVENARPGHPGDPADSRDPAPFRRL